MKTQAQFTHSSFRFDQTNPTNLVLTLTAPKLDWERERLPICIVPVIDISGSMDGSKIDYAKQSVMKLIDNLQPGDFCGLITFGNSAYEIAPIVEVTQQRKDELKAKVGAIRANESTNFSEGMLMALSRLKSQDLPENVILRAIMFTDGLPNRGVVDPTGLMRALEANMDRASISFFGYGDDANQDLLADLASKGKGNYAYVKNPEDALTAFAKELGGLLSTYATDIVIDLSAHGDHKFVEVISDVDSEAENDGRVKIKLPEMLSEETRHIVLGVQLAEQKSAGPRAVNAVTMKLSYSAMDLRGKKATVIDEVKAKVQFVKPGEEQTQPDKDLDLIVSTAKLVQTQLEAERLAKNGDFRGANARWDALIGYFGQHNHTNHLGAATSFKSKYVSNAVYGASSAFLKSASKGLTRSVGYYSTDAEANSLIGSATFGSATVNSAQERMTQAFVGTAPAVENSDPSKLAQGSEKPDFGGGVQVTVNVQSVPPASKLTKQKSKRW